MPNYGDVVLSLPPDWSRTGIAGSQVFMLTAVGHENGVADAYLTEKPNQAHQFYWVDSNDGSAISIAKTRHYEFCTAAGWTKNPNLWEWDAEQYITHNGLRLMARPDKFFYDDEARRTAEETVKSKSMVTREARTAEDQLESVGGGIITDERGRQLRPLSEKRR